MKQWGPAGAGLDRALGAVLRILLFLLKAMGSYEGELSKGVVQSDLQFEVITLGQEWRWKAS